MKLFMFYVGGDCANSNIELHDVRFSVGATAEDCHDDLRTQWWGTRKSLHLDWWGAVEQAGGYDIELVADPVDNPGTLFFVNLGGYDRAEFGELHRNVLVVAADGKAAKAAALAQVQGWAQPHRDSLFEVEKAVDINALMRGRGYFLKLTKAAADRPFAFVSRYLPLG